MIAEPQFRLAELIAALSLAADLGMGQSWEHALRTCLLALGIGEELGATDAELVDVYYVALLRFVGCTADSHETHAFAGGDDVEFRAGMAPLFMAEVPDLLGYVLGWHARTRGRTGRPGRAAIDRIKREAAAATAAHCEAAEMLAARLGLSPRVQGALRHAFERWDGTGLPGGLCGEEIPLAARIVIVARDAEAVYRESGFARARELVKQRRGRAYDPKASDVILRSGSRLLLEIGRQPAWAAALDAEPGAGQIVPEAKLDTILSAFAELADVKCPFTLGHSTGVAQLARRAARGLGVTDHEAAVVYRAGLLHDLGRVGVSNAIWEKPGALTPGERAAMRLHSHLTERILSSCRALAPLAPVASSPHERLDGGGYHRGCRAAALPMPARVLAAADAYQGMTQVRPHRPAHSAQAAAALLVKDASAGRLDRNAVEAVIAAAGNRQRRVRPAWPAGLSEREVQVLRLVCQGYPNHRVASTLGISPKTVGHHVQHIYDKIGASTRAGAAIFAMRHDLLQP